jgi:hypothetical protein
MLIVATLPSTLILYLWAVLVWQWYNRLCLSETCLKWQRLSKVPPNARCVPSYDFSTQKVNVQWKFTKKIVAVCGNVMNRQNVTKWCRELCGGRTDVHDEQSSGRPSLISDDLLQEIQGEISANRRVTSQSTEIKVKYSCKWTKKIWHLRSSGLLRSVQCSFLTDRSGTTYRSNL